jgi:murein DD-endopeptidase MepM/ murein hydrolase activator NlpD
MLLATISSGDETLPTASCVTVTADIDRILATIRTLESGGDYTARAGRSTASGAYQFLDSTWDSYGGYRRAGDAPPAVQDARAAADVQAILDRHDGDVSAVPVVWYIGRLPAEGSPDWDRIPAPEAGNRLTPRQYQARWLAEYDRQPAEAPVTTSTTSPTETTLRVALPGSCVGGSIEPLAGGWSLPGPRELIDANPAALDAPHHDYPAWDWLVPINTPVYAVRGGTVVNIRSWPHNWWTSGCGQSGGGACSTCGVGVTIEDEQGVRWTYCHGTNVTVTLNAVVNAGTQIMWSGNTGRSGTPHLHLEIRVAGEQRCPQRLLRRLYDSHVGLDPTSLPSAGCSD